LPQLIAAIYLALDDKKKSLEWLEGALAIRASTLMWLKVDPWFDQLREEKGYKSLLARLGLE
jgi:hypothetical protein